jgi:DMSO reductase family type II enzyme chaperone
MLYAILVQGLSTPTDALCRALQDDTFGAMLQHALGGAPRNHRRRFAHDLTASAAGNTMDELLVEYTRLFGTDLVCPHYEADYVAAGSFRLAQVLADVTGLYAAFGVRVSDTAHERPDHIVVELDFMNFLATKEAHAAHEGQSEKARLCRQAQRLFFERHLGRWARPFSRHFGAAARLDFYLRLRQLLESLLMAEAEYLHIPLVEIEVKPGSQGGDASADGKSVCGHCAGHR